MKRDLESEKTRAQYDAIGAKLFVTSAMAAAIESGCTNTDALSPQKRHFHDPPTIREMLDKMEKLPPPPKWKACVVKPRYLARVREASKMHAPSPGFLGDLGGLPIHVKHGQSADAWMFSDDETLRRYLKGELSELDLFEMMASGACLPNDKLTDTNNIHDAHQFDTKEACEKWIAENSPPEWKATEHGFC